MHKYLIIPALFLNLAIHAQYGSLKVTVLVSANRNEPEEPFTLKIICQDENKTVFEESNQYPEPLELDSMLPGQYLLKIQDKASSELLVSKQFQIVSGELTKLNVNLYLYESKEKMDSLVFVKGRSDGELQLGYTDDKRFDPNSVFANGFLVGVGGHYWNAYTPHFGALFGYGLNYRYQPVANDTSFIPSPGSFTKKHEAFNYLGLHFDAKIRLSGGDQRVAASSPKFLFELGALYNLPLLFSYTGKYSGNKRVSERHIHQFLDFRAFVNIGYYPFVLFYEYRLSDFVLGRYPELPRSTVGLRILIFALINDRDD